jgi:Zn-dependent protease
MKFRLGSIPIQVQPSFFVASAMLGWRGETVEVAIWVIVCFVSILVHEMGHALVIARFGGTPSVLLYPGGGLTYGDKSKTPGRRIFVSLAGPAAGFVLAGAVFALARLHPPHGMQRIVYADLMWVNLSWGLFNLVPMLPLDGGNTFESLVALRWPARARIVAEVVSAVCCAAIAVTALAMGRMVLAVMALYWGGSVFRALYKRVEDHRDREVAERLDELRALRRTPKTEQAFELAQALFAQARTSTYRRAVAAELVLLHADRGEPAAIAPLISAHFQGAAVPQPVWLSQLLASEGAEKVIDRIEADALASDSPDDLGVFLDACAELSDRDRAAAALGKMPDREAASEVVRLRSTVHFYAGRFEASLTLCEAGVLAFGESLHAYNAACCLARLGRVDEGLAALQRTWELAPGRFAHDIDADGDLAALRADGRWRAVRAGLLGLLVLSLSSGCTTNRIVFTTILADDGATRGAGGSRPEPDVDASVGPDAPGPRPPSEIAPSLDCPRGVPSSGNLGGCEYNGLGPNQPQPGTLSLMKLRVTGPDGIAAYCLRPHCTVDPGRALTAKVTSDASNLVSVQFGQQMPTSNPWTLEMNLDRSEDGAYMSSGTAGSCFPSEITASQPVPGGAYPPFSRLWSCRLFRTDGMGFDVDGCVWCTGWDAN